MLYACISLLTVIMLIVMSFRANRRFAHESRLPMQWSMTGSVNWTAPRVLALSFMPLLGAIMLGMMGVAMATTPPRLGQEALALPVMMATSIALIAIHAFHLWLIRRTVAKRSR